MQEVSPDMELETLLAKYSDGGGVLDYVLLRSGKDLQCDDVHRAAALAAISVIDSRLAEFASKMADDEHPPEAFFRLDWDANKLSGKRVSFSEFWGTDNVAFEPIGHNAWSIPDVDGYKTAFFLPPHGLSGSDDEKEQLFDAINKQVLGSHPELAEIFWWSTDWSNYFDSGHEWWGSFMWTVRPVGENRISVIGASSTD